MRFLIISLCLMPLIAFSQLNDDFSDGDFTNNPSWFGDQDLFKVNTALQLQLNHSEAGSAFLSNSIGLNDSIEWRFSIRLAFSPSATNYARVFLMADNRNLTEALNGYYLQFGEALGEDAVELFYQNGDQSISICRGSNGKIAGAFDINIKVTYATNGNWKVLVDWAKNGNYMDECSVKHFSNISNPFFGFYCLFTSSNATKFYMDNISVDHIYVDTDAPDLQYIEIVDANKLNLKFNETLDPLSAENIQNYHLQQNNQIPESASLNMSDPSEVLLVFSSAFEPNQSQTLLVNSIQDIAGNTSANFSFDFFFSRAEYGDIIIHEIMADPNPPQGLPEAEYLELFNRIEYPVSLKGWKLFNGNSIYHFPDILLTAHSYLLLTHPNNADLFENEGDIVSVPSFSLTNSGNRLILNNNLNQVIHFIEYNDDWYNDDFKAEGGWSLEMISPDYFCEQSINWSASQNSDGGTPGKSNSLSNLIVQYQSPEIETLNLLDTHNLLIRFSKSMDSTALKNPVNYFVDNSIGQPEEVRIFAPEYQTAQFSFVYPFKEKTIYQISIEPNLIGCCGSELSNSSRSFAIPQEPDFIDIIFNEVLFYSWIDDGDYVELFNRSDKVIDSRQLLFSRITTNKYDTIFYSVQPDAGQFFPGEYLLLCKNKSSVLDVYYAQNPENIYASEGFSILTNTEGQLLLSKASNKSFLIDYFSYSEDMHFPLINNVSGVALERLSPEVATNDPNNWQSAAASVNYGTPTYQNSQFQLATQVEDVFQISPEIFSPDLDGFDDILQINYVFSQGGYTLNLLIFNAQGQRIKHLIKNELMGISGQIFWDGTTEEGDKAALGIYILYIEYFDLNGKVEKLKKTCVLGGKL